MIDALAHLPPRKVSAANDPITPARKAFDACNLAEGAGATPILLALTAEGGHSMIWPEGWAAERAWSCGILAEWVLAVVAEKDGE